MRKISKKSIKKVNICQKKAFIVVFYRKTMLFPEFYKKLEYCLFIEQQSPLQVELVDH